MRLVNSSKVFVKVAMVLMLVLSVLISGCTGDDEKEWKKASDDFIIAYSDLIEFYKKRATEQVDIELSKWDEYQKDTFYLARGEMIKINEQFENLKKMAKDNEKRQKFIKPYIQELANSKNEILAKGKASRIVPKEHMNFDKNVNVPKIEANKTYKDFRNGRIIKATYPKGYVGGTENKEVKVKQETVTVKDSNQPKQNSASETKKEESVKKSAIITGTEVRFRQNGNLNGKILGYFDKGEKVTVLAKENGWCKVQRANGTVGYVSSDFCK